MSTHPILKQHTDFTEIEESVRNLHAAASLFNYIGVVGMSGAQVGTTPDRDDMQGLAWLGETIKGMTGDLQAMLFPKSSGGGS